MTGPRKRTSSRLIDETIERSVVPHFLLRSTAQHQLDLARRSNRGQVLHVVSSNLAAAFAAEAYLNYAGLHLARQAQEIASYAKCMDTASVLRALTCHHELVAVPERAADVLAYHQRADWLALWNERDNPPLKLEKVHKFVGLPVQWGQRPLQSVADLVKFRNDLVHAKPEDVGPFTHTTRDHRKWSQPNEILTAWERALGLGNDTMDLEITQRRLDDLDSIFAALSDSIGMGIRWILGDTEARLRSPSTKKPRARRKR